MICNIIRRGLPSAGLMIHKGKYYSVTLEGVLGSRGDVRKFNEELKLDDLSLTNLFICVRGSRRDMIEPHITL